MSKKIARITQDKKLLLANEVVEDNTKIRLNSDGRLDTDEIIEYPAELEGGRNLILNSTDYSNLIRIYGVTGSVSVENYDGSPYGKVWHLSDIERTYGNYVWYIPLKSLAPEFTDVGAEYTLSFWMKTNSEQYLTVGINHVDVKTYSDRQVDTKYKRFKIVVSPRNDGENYNCHILLSGNNLTDVYVYGVKLEKGTKATPWTPAPEDLGLNYPDSIQNFNSSISGNNIIVPEFIEGYPFVKPVIDDSLVLWLDGSTGNNYEQTGIWKDLSGNGNHGQLMNFGYIEDSGWGDGGLRFDGVDDYVDCGKINFGTENFTIEMIAKINGIPNQYGGTIIGNRGGLWGQADTDGVGTELSFPQNRNRIDFRIADGENIKTQFATFDFTDNKQHHIIAQKTSTEMKIYIDGVLKGTVNHTVIGEINGHYSMKIGCRGNQGYFSDTNIYLTRIYNRALTDKEILQNYQAGQCSLLLAMRGD